jgi:hypothetical protein
MTNKNVLLILKNKKTLCVWNANTYGFKFENTKILDENISREIVHINYTQKNDLLNLNTIIKNCGIKDTDIEFYCEHSINKQHFHGKKNIRFHTFIY